MELALPAMTPKLMLHCLAGLTAALAVAAAQPTRSAPPVADFPDIGYASWTEAEPPYRIYPGDEIEVTVPSAPELNKTLVVQPDGRVSLPLIHATMVADRTPAEVEAALGAAYASQLIRPEVYVSVKTATPLKVFVGGEVDKPGVYDMPGDINALQGVIQAGGFKGSAKRNHVVIIRRGPDGRAMMRTVDLRRGISDRAGSDLVPLRRFDIVYVPRTGLAGAGLFMSQLRDLLPGALGFSYALNNRTVTTSGTGSGS
jgi:protein involved in polysaccharide export with SLBB domain